MRKLIKSRYENSKTTIVSMEKNSDSIALQQIDGSKLERVAFWGEEFDQIVAFVNEVRSNGALQRPFETDGKTS